MQSISYLFHVAFSPLPLETINLFELLIVRLIWPCFLLPYTTQTCVILPIPQTQPFSLDRCLEFQCSVLARVHDRIINLLLDFDRRERDLRVRCKSETLAPNAHRLCFVFGVPVSVFTKRVPPEGRREKTAGPSALACLSNLQIN